MTRGALHSLRSSRRSALPDRTSAEIARFPKARLPDQIEDFGKCCSRLISGTFPAPSQHQVCQLAARALGVSVDTIDRILSGRVAKCDGRLLFLCLGLYQHRTGTAFPVGGGFEIRITQAGGQE